MQCKIVTKNSIQNTIVLVKIPQIEIPEITGMEIYLENNIKKNKVCFIELVSSVDIWVSIPHVPFWETKYVQSAS